MHAPPLPQGGHMGPPQSVPVSLPFFTPSVQVGAWHVAPEHTPLAQSLGMAQPPPAVHGAQIGPPQSVPVSPPFFTPSVHLGVWQMFPVQTPSTQSVGSEHAFPSAHGGHAGPPQSTAVSWPSFIPSVHVGGTHACITQTLPPEQSGVPRQPTHAPAKHFAPPYAVHDVPSAVFIVPGVPPEHVPLTHVFAGVATFASSGTMTMFPAPSHWFLWQEPAGGCACVGVAAGAFVVPQAPPSHVAGTHSFFPGGQAAA
jgi:hypothetical protein